MNLKRNMILTHIGNSKEEVLKAIDFDERIKAKASFIFSEPKGELFKLSKEVLEKEGYVIKEISLCEEYNPLDIIVNAYEKGDLEKALLLCKNLTYTMYCELNTDYFWNESAMSLVNALILSVIDSVIFDMKFLGAQKEEFKAEITLKKIGEVLVDSDVKELDKYFNNLSDNNIAKKEYFGGAFQQCIDKEYVIKYALSEILKYRSPKKKTLINLNDLVDIGFKNEKDNRPVALVLKGFDNMSFSHALSSIFIGQLYYALAKTADKGSGKCDRAVSFIVEQVGRKYPIKNLYAIFSVGIARKIFFNLVVEHMYAYELDYVYGKDVAVTILNNCEKKEL